jgi:perosamine synthetase
LRSDAPLAIHGGPRAVTGGYRERWRGVHRRDVARIARHGLRDVSTLSKGEGPIKEFEERFAALTGSRHALAMNSGTATLHSAYFAAGARPGTEVIVPSYTFFASAAPILQCGATPVFCDVDPETLTADPRDVERRITKRTKAICVVHMWGNPAPMDRLAEIARRHGVALIEDCSHAHGATYQGRPVGSWGDVGCFSLQGAKAVSGGEAGIAVTDDPVLFDRMLLLGHYGRLKKGQAAKTFRSDHLSLGVKYRPHLYAVLLATGSLERLGELNRRRRDNYAILEEELAGCAAVRPVPTTPGAVRGGFLEYILHYDPERAAGVGQEAFIAAAAAEGVPVAAERYAAVGPGRRLLHETAIFTSPDVAAAGGALPGPRPAGELPATAALQGRLLTLPPFTKVPERFVRQCARALRKVADRAVAIPEPRRPGGGQAPASATRDWDRADGWVASRSQSSPSSASSEPSITA